MENNIITISTVLEKSSNLRERIERTCTQEEKTIFIPKLNELLNKYDASKDMMVLNTEIEALEKEVCDKN